MPTFSFVLFLILSVSAWGSAAHILTGIKKLAMTTIGESSGQVGRLPIKIGVMGWKAKDLLFQMSTKNGTDILIFVGNAKKTLTMVRMTGIMSHGAWRNSSYVLREHNTKLAQKVDQKLQRLVNSNLDDAGVDIKVKSKPFSNLDLGDTTGTQFDLSSYHFDEATLAQLDVSFFENLLIDASKL